MVNVTETSLRHFTTDCQYKIHSSMQIPLHIWHLMIVTHTFNTETFYTQKVDIWTCGVVLYRLIYGRMPFDDDPAASKGKGKSTRSTQPGATDPNHFQETCDRIQRCDLYFSEYRSIRKRTVKVSEPLLELLAGILTKAKRRWSLRQISECEWLRDVEVRVHEEDLCPTDEGCQQSTEDVRELLLEAKSIPGATPKLPPVAVMPPAGIHQFIRNVACNVSNAHYVGNRSLQASYEDQHLQIVYTSLPQLSIIPEETANKSSGFITNSVSKIQTLCVLCALKYGQVYPSDPENYHSCFNWIVKDVLLAVRSH